MAALVCLGHSIRTSIDDHERRVLPFELVRHDRPYPPVPADDVMVLQMVDHACVPPMFNILRPAPLDDNGCERREGIERRADADDDQQERKRLPRR
jgi:hypothetical protein